MPDDASFAWQHDAVPHADGTLSMFDNDIGSTPGSQLDAQSDAVPSSGLLLNIDESGRTVRLKQRFQHPDPLHANTQGSVQMLADGSAFIGWGELPYASLFDPAGNLVWDARIADPWHSYRAHVSEWTGTPDDAPAVVAQRKPFGGATVHVSWNGATDVATWRVLAGRAPDSLRRVADMPRTGFESSSDVPGAEWFAVAALDGDGTELARSAPVQPVPHLS